MASSLLVTIRCAHQSYKDLNVEIQADWTVKCLKAHLEEVFPSKPKADKQRLIYAGQLMKDSEKVSKYLSRQPVDHLPIIHLVCAPAVQPLISAESSGGLRRRQIPTPQQRNLHEAGVQATNVDGAIPNPTLQHQVPPLIDQSAYQQAQPMYFSPYSMPNMMQQQMAATDPSWMAGQQMYNVYMMQYMQYLQQLYGTVYFPGAMGAASIYPDPGQMYPNTAPNVVETLPVEQQQPPRAAAPAEPALNAQGGVDDDDDVRNRDWLDWLYMGCRALLLFTILYFYSSMERFTFVMLCCAMIYGLQAGWFGRRRNEEAVQPNQQQGGQRPGAAVAANNENENNEQSNENTPPSEPVSETPEVPQTAWYVFWSTCWTFISTFFASLVPQRPPPMNVN